MATRAAHRWEDGRLAWTAAISVTGDAGVPRFQYLWRSAPISGSPSLIAEHVRLQI
jgi:hypothetical protein